MFTDFDFTPVKYYLEIPETNKYTYRIDGDTVIPKLAALVEHHEVRSEKAKQMHSSYNDNKNIAFYAHRSVFKPVEGHLKDPHSISEHEVYFVENNNIPVTAKEIGDFYVDYIEHNHRLNSIFQE